ncbi:MAG TPA: outer membrane protein assembly factor [Bacteroidales bacterium]|nr:outer membrane protein assembly factor [Bacteroidales bacterium]
MNLILFLLIIEMNFFDTVVKINKIKALKSTRFTNYFSRYCSLSIYLLIFTLLFSCSPARHVPEDKYLLDKSKIRISKSDLKKDELKIYIRQKPNKRILGLRFHLWLYNMSNPKKEKGVSNWLRRIGEEPVLFDEYLTEKSNTQLNAFLNTKGYYNSTVKDSVIFNRKKAKVYYYIKPNQPYKIKSLNYLIEDEGIKPIVMTDTPNSLIKIGDNFDRDMLQDERKRIETLLKQKGYFNFDKQYVYFQADSSSQNLTVDITLVVKQFQQKDTSELNKTSNHKKYYINNVYVYTNFDPRKSLIYKQDYFNSFDTTYSNGIYFIKQAGERSSNKVIFQSNFLKEVSLYSLDNSNSTFQHLNSLRLYKLINIQFKELFPLANDSLDVGYLDCTIQLTRFNLQSYTVEFQGTNSSGNLGVGGNLLYQNKSFFGGAEIVDFKLNGSVETLNEQIQRINNTIELGGDITVSIPKFILPVFRAEEFSKKYKPKTHISIGYNYQDRPDYRRTIANIAYGYSWDGNKYNKHILRLIELNAVKLPYVTQDFKEYIEKTLLSSSYENHLVSVTNYSFIFNNQDIKKNKDFYYFRLNSELSGNILSAISEISNSKTNNGSYEIFGLPYSQFVKLDFDFRYYQILNETNNFVYRIFVGAGMPYGNSSAIPFEKKYFSGGANSIRAWSVRSLGPGSYTGDTISDYPNQTADIKLEANFEYRFKLFWVLEGALFLDAGNIWSIKEDNREGAFFNKNEFYKEIAIGSGLGFRFDLSFVILRCDIGIKLRDPSLPSDQRWIVGNREFVRNDLSFNIGIGYPF